MILIDLQVDCPALCPLNDACRMLPSGGLQEEAQEPLFYMRGARACAGLRWSISGHISCGPLSLLLHTYSLTGIYSFFTSSGPHFCPVAPLATPPLYHPAIFMSSTKATNSSYTSFSDGRSSSPAYRYKPVGIVNEFNTCFLNSTFQAVRDFFSDTCMDH